MFRQEICPLARNSIIAKSLKQCTFFIRGLEIWISYLHKKNLVAQMSLFSFLYLKVNRITTGWSSKLHGHVRGYGVFFKGLRSSWQQSTTNIGSQCVLARCRAIAAKGTAQLRREVRPSEQWTQWDINKLSWQRLYAQ